MEIDKKNLLSGPVTPVATPLSHSSLRETMSGTPGPITHIKQDMMYPSSMASPTPPNSRQVCVKTCQFFNSHQLGKIKEE